MNRNQNIKKYKIFWKLSNFIKIEILVKIEINIIVSINSLLKYLFVKFKSIKFIYLKLVVNTQLISIIYYKSFYKGYWKYLFITLAISSKYNRLNKQRETVWIRVSCCK